MTTKRQLIDDIIRLNPSATPEFLAEFSENELYAYLQQLLGLRPERREVAFTFHQEGVLAN